MNMKNVFVILVTIVVLALTDLSASEEVNPQMACARLAFPIAKKAVENSGIEIDDFADKVGKISSDAYDTPTETITWTERVQMRCVMHSIFMLTALLKDEQKTLPEIRKVVQFFVDDYYPRNAEM
jgi:hypothetical protein